MQLSCVQTWYAHVFYYWYVARGGEAGCLNLYEGLDVSSSGKSAKLGRLPGSEQRVGAVVRANLSR